MNLWLAEHKLATSLRKHVIKVCTIEYLTTQTELVSPTFKSWTVHKIIQGGPKKAAPLTHDHNSVKS